MPVPAFGYSPETKTYIGAVSLFTLDFYKDSLTRSSNAKIEFNYTWNKQIVLEGGWNYFFRQEKWFTKGLIRYAQYPDFYFGIGTNTPDSNKLVFNSNRFVSDIFLLKKISTQLFSGINLKYISYSKIKTEQPDLRYPELKVGRTFGVGYTIIKDARNNILSPSKGHYFFANTVYNFAQKNYLELTFDCRLYKSWNEKLISATRLIQDFNFGTIPFYDLAFLGGDQYVRGYYFGRFRDQHLSSIQQEFRMPIYWRFGLATFGGLSTIYSDKYPFGLGNIKYNYGLGLRFVVDKKDKTNLRIDYAIGTNSNSGFYISFGESF
ncbi:MAG: BamA/TamA family outer membrane protein [Bacteroidota bacterium]